MEIFCALLVGGLATVTSLNLILFGPYWWSFWFVHLGLAELGTALSPGDPAS